MVDNDIGSVVVADGARPVGERDLTQRILDQPALLTLHVGDVMSSPVVSVQPEVQVVGAFELMNAKNIRRLVIVDDDRLVGIVTERDLLRWVGAVAAE